MARHSLTWLGWVALHGAAIAACAPYASVNYAGEPQLSLDVTALGDEELALGGGVAVLWPHHGDLVRDAESASAAFVDSGGLDLGSGTTPLQAQVDLIDRPRVNGADHGYLLDDLLLGVVVARSSFTAPWMRGAVHDRRVAFAATDEAAAAAGLSARGYTLLARSEDTPFDPTCGDAARLDRVDCRARCRVAWAGCSAVCASGTTCPRACRDDRDSCLVGCEERGADADEACAASSWVEVEPEALALSLDADAALDAHWREWDLVACDALMIATAACVDACGLDGFSACAERCRTEVSPTVYCGPPAGLDLCEARAACAADPAAACRRRCGDDAACLDGCESDEPTAGGCVDLYDPFRWCGPT